MRNPLRSIRARLTAWYALLLLLIILVLGAGVSYLLERELRDEVDNQLMKTATEMTSQIDVAVRFDGVWLVGPPPGIFSFPSQLFQVVDNSGTVWFKSENLGEHDLPFDEETVAAEETEYDTVGLDGVTIRTITYPFELRGTVIGSVIVGQPLVQVNSTLADLRRQFVLASVIGAVLAAVGGWLIARRALRPVDEMTATARRIASTSVDALPLETRLAVSNTGDEVDRLGDTFNNLLDRLQESLELQRRFVADASHELRTPLTAVQGNIDLLEKQLDREQANSDPTDETISELRRESKRMNRLVSDLLTLARLESSATPTMHLYQQPLNPIAEDAVRTAAAMHPDIPFSVQADQKVEGLVDRDRLEQVMVILLDNAANHSQSGSPVVLRLAGAGETARFDVTDEGAGIPAADLPNIFERFYRVDTARTRAKGGSGLGLAIAQAVLKAHDGSIEISSTEGAGTSVKVTLPSETLAAGRV